MDKAEQIKATLREICEADPSEHFELVQKAQEQIDELINTLMKQIFKAMTKLDNAIPDWAFDSENGHKMQDAIDDVYESIAEAREVQDA